jgi:DNA modification methylase
MKVQDKIEMLQCAALVPYARNSRTHSKEQIAQIAASIREFGFTNPVLIDAEGGIVAGHGRVLGAQSIGMVSVPCLRVDWLTEAQKKAYVITDNQLALNAGWDNEVLTAELRDLQQDGFALDLLGFTDEYLDSLLTAGVGDTAKDPEACPPLAADPISVLGDVWLLGQHRLICGDCTTQPAIDALMMGEMADVCWTDPPYNVAYETKAGKIENDDIDDASFAKFLSDFYRTACSVMKPGAAIYVAHGDLNGRSAIFASSMLSAGFHIQNQIIWKKSSLVMGRMDYQSIHEPIWYGWKRGGAHRWFGGRKQTTVEQIGDGSPFVKRADGKWELHLGAGIFVVDGKAEIEELLTSVITENKPDRNDVHPTMKPVALIERQLRNSARSGDIVLDTFGGSGSTLMAAERIGMKARLSELSPVYVDVIVRRWQEYTGQRAYHAATGQPFPVAG